MDVTSSLGRVTAGFLAGLALVLSASAGATTASSISTPAVGAADCAFHADAFFWTGGADRLRLAQALAADKAPCVEYWISIAPLAGDKKALRVRDDDEIRALGIHPVAEFTTGENTGWANWVNEPGKNRTWYDAGVEFRRRMAQAGYDVTAGETWLINEFDRSTARDAPREPPDHPWPPALRKDMRELMHGLYDGAPGMPKAPGVAEIGINFRHQNIPDVARYRLDMQGWLADSAFWADADRYLRWIAVENYPDSRLWAPEGSSLRDRDRHLGAYLFHVLDLVRTGPQTARTTKSFFERKFLPLANAGWRARGGDQFDFVTGHGNTILDDVQMRQFVSEQVYAMRRYAAMHRLRAPDGRLGFSWQPCNRLSATEPECRPSDAAFRASQEAITARIAEAIRFAYGEGRSSAGSACVSRDETDWCRGSLAGAKFTTAWDDFRWSGAGAASAPVTVVRFSPDGRLLASATDPGPDKPGVVRLWRSQIRTPAGRLVGQSGGVHDLAFSPDGRLIASAGVDGTVRLWDVGRRREVGRPLRGHSDAVWRVVFSPDGRLLATASEDGTARLWSVSNHRQVGAPIPVEQGYDVAFSPDGRTLFTAAFATSAWDVRTHRGLGSFCASAFGVRDVEVSPDGTLLACAFGASTPSSTARLLEFWSLRNHKRIGAPLGGHRGAVSSIAFSRTGHELASGGGIGDETIRVWDVRARTLLGRPIRGHTSGIASLAFSPDGNMLASGSWDGTVRVWNVSTHRPIGKPLSG